MDILRSILAAALGVVVTTPRATTNDALQVSVAIAPCCTILVPDLDREVIQHLDSVDATDIVKVDCNDVLPLSIRFVPDDTDDIDSFSGSDPMTALQAQQVDGDLADVVSVITF